MKEYRAQLDADRAKRLSKGTNHANLRVRADDMKSKAWPSSPCLDMRHPDTLASQPYEPDMMACGMKHATSMPTSSSSSHILGGCRRRRKRSEKERRRTKRRRRSTRRTARRKGQRRPQRSQVQGMTAVVLLRAITHWMASLMGPSHCQSSCRVSERQERQGVQDRSLTNDISRPHIWAGSP